MSPTTPSLPRPPLAVVSACLLGRACRYDGRHKLVPTLRADLLRRGFHVLALCPETGAGLPVPRPPMDLHRLPGGAIRCLRQDGTDLTPALAAWIDATIRRLLPLAPSLFILKSKSPSCGLALDPPGLFADAARRAFPAARFLDEHDLPL